MRRYGAAHEREINALADVVAMAPYAPDQWRGSNRGIPEGLAVKTLWRKTAYPSLGNRPVHKVTFLGEEHKYQPEEDGDRAIDSRS